MNSGVAAGALLAALSRRGPLAFTLTSAAFPDGGPIPQQFTCDGADHSPPLAWSGTPAAAKALALIADDPDAPAGTWVHWVLYNLPSSTTALPQNLAKTETVKDVSGEGALQGRNDFRRIGYGGPCPPPGKPHRYLFKLYALDVLLGLRAGVTKGEVERAMAGHIVDQTQLMGTYARQRH